jgi:hypothetical protein
MMITYFASAQRAEKEELTNQIVAVKNNQILNSLLMVVDGLMAVLNEHRQIIALNKNLLNTLGIDDAGKALGLRPGEAINCTHAQKMPGGCGTSEFCSTCGAAIAIVTSLSDGNPAERMCAVTVENNNEKKDLFFRVRSQPLTLEGQDYLLLFLQDITRQQQWAIVERIFFHDLNNIISGLLNASELLTNQQPTNNLIGIIQNLSTQLSNEVAIQSYLNKAGIPEYKPILNHVTVDEAVHEIQKTLFSHPSLENKQLVFQQQLPKSKFRTSLNLFSRVLVNMVINALEASNSGETVKVSVADEKNHITFSVWNQMTIPDDISKRIFQRNFSTKAKMGRGWGTYSMKLLGENILGGQVFFTSSSENGTTFSLKLPR